VIILFMTSCILFAKISENILIKSPNNEIQFEIGVKHDNENKLYYNILFKNELIIKDSGLNLEFNKS